MLPIDGHRYWATVSLLVMSSRKVPPPPDGVKCWRRCSLYARRHLAAERRVILAEHGQLRLLGQPGRRDSGLSISTSWSRCIWAVLSGWLRLC